MTDALNSYINKLHQFGNRAIRHKNKTPCQIYYYIYKTLRSLKNNPDIIIKPADKNLGIVILNRNDYKDMCLAHLHDTSTYKKIEDKFYVNHTWAKLHRILDSFNIRLVNKNKSKLTYFARSLCQLQSSTNLRPSVFYCLPKMHKNKYPIPGRPIASAPSTITYHTSIYLNNILKPLIQYLPTVCNCSSEIIKLLNSQQFPDESILFTADVKSLYPSIPIQLGLESIKYILALTNKFTDRKIQLLLQLLHWVLTNLNNFIIFDKEIYLQIEGTAMGTPVAPTYAILFMFGIERKLIKQSLFYKRYIDDILAIFTSQEAIQEFILKVNSSVPNNQLTLESITTGNQCNFLDLTITIDGGQISTEIYQKPHNTFAYIPTYSDHPRSMFSSFVLEELKRLYRSCSDYNKFIIASDKFKNNLANRGYQPDIFNHALNNLLTKHLPINIRTSKFQQSIFHAPTLDNFNPVVLQPLNLKNKKSQRQKINNQPILILSLPILNYSIKWNEFTTIPDDLQGTISFQRAYKSADVMISKRSPRSLGNIYISSLF